MIKKIPSGDVLVFCGDICSQRDTLRDGIKKKKIPISITNFNRIIGKLDHKVKICIVGNHDYVDKFSADYIQKKILTNFVYLEDSMFELDVEKIFPEKKCVERKVVKFYGSPWTNISMAYHGDEKKLKKVWGDIPKDTNVLLTHVPPLNVLDLGLKNSRPGRSKKCSICGKRHVTMKHFGCQFLKERVLEIAGDNEGDLMYHCFGHSHENGGKKVIHEIEDKRKLTFVNGARRPIKVLIKL